MHNVTGADVRLGEWLDAAAARRATPGGGSVSALVGALAAAMGEMTLNFSVGRKGNAAGVDERLAANLAELARARDLLVRLMVEDQRAYAELTAARKLDDAEPGKAGRVDAATAAAIAVPQAIAATGLRVLEHAAEVAADANPWLLSDLLICGELALATVRCGTHNVAANLADVAPPEAARLRAESEAATRRGVGLIRALHEPVARRTQRGG